nr:hypothetical protein [Tanacetum cinerariifolium]
MFVPSDLRVPKLQIAEDLQGDALLHYDAKIKLMNLILLSIPNDIYNSVDACTLAKDMWKRVERLMRGTIQNKVDRKTRFTTKFDQFVAEPGEAFVFLYNRFAQLMNDLERNDMHFPIVTINTKFLNSLQPKWLKYVIQVRLAKRLPVDTFDDLFYYLYQFEKLVNTSRAKKLEKSHDLLALVAHTSSSSKNTSSYYVTHPTSVVDYHDEYQQDDILTNSENPLTSAMLLLARAITQNFSNPTNNRLRTSSNTRNQAVIQGDRVNIQGMNAAASQFMLGKNKQTDNTFANVISNKENLIDVDVANASKAKNLLCVPCMQNVLIPCHDKCLAHHRLNASRTSTTKSSTPKSSDTTYVALKTSGSSKHMTSDRSLLRNFIKKFMGTVRFGNDNFAAITGYGDYIHGKITICHVYYVESLGHNLFSVRQFCNGGRKSNLYTSSISDLAASSHVCLMSKATSTKSWLWHRRLSHLNFDTVNDLTRLDLVDGLPKFKYEKGHLCSACEKGKRKKASHPPKLVSSDNSKLELLHMDLCNPMRIASISGNKYILVIVDGYSRYTWVYFHHSKGETPEIIKKFIAQAQLNNKAKICKIRIDNGTEFKNANLKAYYEKLGIMQQFSTA